MKESQFIEQNKKKWRAFEKELDRKPIQPKKISEYYIDTLDDLSFARSHYPKRQVRSYLNGVTRVLSLRITKTQKSNWRDIKAFWAVDLPLIMYHNRKQLLLAFILFAISFSIGVLSSIYDKNFANYILGDEYVQMTLKNIEEGKPMGVYDNTGETSMFVGITTNNIRVSLITYMLSLFIGIGTIFALIGNGVMLGAFQFFFFERDLGFESFLTIWQHGTIEISCIILAGTAGFVLAKGILFPGTLSRFDAFRVSGRMSLLILLGLIPLLVLAGFIEAFITRHTDLPDLLRLSGILLSATFVIGYFVIYPFRVAAKHKLEDVVQINLQPIKLPEFDPQIKISQTTLAGISLNQFIKNSSMLLLAVAILTGVTFFWLLNSGLVIPFGSLEHPTNYLIPTDLVFPGFGWRITLLKFFVLLSSFFLANSILDRIINKSTTLSAIRKSTRKLGLLSFLAIVSAAIMTNYFSIGLLLFWFPIAGWLMAASLSSQISILDQLPQMKLILKAGIGRMLVTMFIIVILMYFGSGLNYGLLELLKYFWDIVVPTDQISPETGLLLLSTVSVTALVLVFFVLAITISGLSYFGFLQNATADYLYQKLDEYFPEVDGNSASKQRLIPKSKLFQP